MPDALVDAMIAHVADAPGDDVYSIWAQGGALGRVPDDATAFTGRGALLDRRGDTMGRPGARQRSHRLVAPGHRADRDRYRLVGTYVNDVSDDADDSTSGPSGGSAKVERLVELKRTWDPDNVFRLNQNIRPSPGLDIPAARAR